MSSPDVKSVQTKNPAPESPSPNQDLMRVVNTVEQLRVKMEDSLVAVDHCLRALFEAKEAAEILERNGLNKKTMARVVGELRRQRLP